MAVNERFVPLLVIKDVTGRRLGNSVSANSPRRNIKLSASPPCGLLNQITGSISLKKKKKFRVQMGAYLGKPMHQPVITEREPFQTETSGARNNVPIILWCAGGGNRPVPMPVQLWVARGEQLRSMTYRIILLGKVRGQEEGYFGGVYR